MVGESISVAAALARRIPVVGGAFGRRERLELGGKVVFVTGAARGIGAEISRQAHARGAYVALVGRTLSPLERLASEFGERAAPFAADVGDFDALQRAAEGVARRFGGIDVVVANAGIAPPADTVLTIDPQDFERTVDIDLLGQWRTIRATLPAVIERRGHILVISSIYAFTNGVLNASYAASKAGIEQLTRAIRVELVPHGATAGVAYLGFVETDMVAGTWSQAHADEARRTLPAFFTKAIPVEQAGRALIDGIEQRSARVAAPGWVLPMLAMRGLVTTVMDETMLHNRGLAQAISHAEARHRNGG